MWAPKAYSDGHRTLKAWTVVARVRWMRRSLAVEQVRGLAFTYAPDRLRFKMRSRAMCSRFASSILHRVQAKTLTLKTGFLEAAWRLGGGITTANFCRRVRERS